MIKRSLSSGYLKFDDNQLTVIVRLSQGTQRHFYEPRALKHI